MSVSVACHLEGTLRGSMMKVTMSAMPVAMTVAQNQKKILRKRLRMISVLCIRSRCEQITAAANRFDPLALPAAHQASFAGYSRGHR